MSKQANYCGVILLLRQLVEAGGCTKKEANKIATQIAAKTNVELFVSV